MSVVMDDKLREILERVGKRSWWPVSLLAEVIDKPKSFIYRRIENDDFIVLNDGGFMKVSTDSVIDYFAQRYTYK